MYTNLKAEWSRKTWPLHTIYSICSSGSFLTIGNAVWCICMGGDPEPFLSALHCTSPGHNRRTLTETYSQPWLQVLWHLPWFSLPVGHHVLFVSILSISICSVNTILIGIIPSHGLLFQKNQYLLVVSNEHGNLKVFLDDIDILDNGIETNCKNDLFSYTKLGQYVQITVNETHALMALVTSDRSASVLMKYYSLESLIL